MTPATGWIDLGKREFFDLDCRIHRDLNRLRSGVEPAIHGAVPLAARRVYALSCRCRRPSFWASTRAGRAGDGAVGRIMVGPIIGPTLGGWLTESFSWRWVLRQPACRHHAFGCAAYLPPTRAALTFRLPLAGHRRCNRCWIAARSIGFRHRDLALRSHPDGDVVFAFISWGPTSS